MKYAKLHSLGNDYLLVDSRSRLDRDYSDIARRICDRATGIGAEGLLLITRSENADLGMVVYNRNGQLGEPNGNNLLCFSRYIYNSGIISGLNPLIETDDGYVQVHIHLNDHRVECFQIDMGIPRLNRQDIPMLGNGSTIDQQLAIGSKRYNVSVLHLRAPHCVLFSGGEQADTIGAEVCGSPLFPKGVNVSFAKVIDRSTMSVETWERNSGITLSNGGGCCAAAVIANYIGLVDSVVDVRQKAGVFSVEIQEDGHVQLFGPAELISEGNVFVED